MNDKTLSRRLYYAAWIFIPAAVVVYMVLHSKGISLITGTCYIYARYGLYCPGCGGTRAINALARGDILTAVYHNVFVVYFAVITIVFMTTQTLDVMTRGRVKGMVLRPVWFITGLGILAGQAVIKNILVLTGTGLY